MFAQSGAPTQAKAALAKASAGAKQIREAGGRADVLIALYGNARRAPLPDAARALGQAAMEGGASIKDAGERRVRLSLLLGVALDPPADGPEAERQLSAVLDVARKDVGSGRVESLVAIASACAKARPPRAREAREVGLEASLAARGLEAPENHGGLLLVASSASASFTPSEASALWRETIAAAPGPWEAFQTSLSASKALSDSNRSESEALRREAAAKVAGLPMERHAEARDALLGLVFDVGRPEEAQSLSEQFERPLDDESRRRLAQGQIRLAGQAVGPEKERRLRLAQEVAERVADPDDRSRALGEVAVEWARFGSLTSARALSRRCGRPADRLRVQIEMLWTEVDARHPELAERVKELRPAEGGGF
jgi:hypothetical protein